MKIADLKSKSPAELSELLVSSTLRLGQLGFERARKTLKTSSDMRKTKTTIAQIKTLLHAHR